VFRSEGFKSGFILIITEFLSRSKRQHLQCKALSG